MSDPDSLENLLKEFYKPSASGSSSTSQDIAQKQSIIAEYKLLKLIVHKMRKAIFDNPNVVD
ncbi:hypothetical protein IWW36_004870, partial [Coemansia brasiliensis]